MKKRKRVYISGRISGLPRNEYMKRFTDAEMYLRKRGYDVVNPTKIVPLWLFRIIGYKLCLLVDLWYLMKCDYIYMLAGWHESKGARCEYAFAKEYGIKRFFKANWNYN